MNYLAKIDIKIILFHFIILLFASHELNNNSKEINLEFEIQKMNFSF